MIPTPTARTSVQTTQIHSRLVEAEMEHSVEFVDDLVVDVRVDLSGPMTVAGNRAWLSAVIGDSRWRPGMKVLIDATEVEPADFFGGDVHQVAMSMVRDADRWGAGYGAVVVDNGAVYGLLQIWRVATTAMEWRTEVFYSRREAIEWLTDPQEQPQT